MSPHRPSRLSSPIRGCWKSLEPLLPLSAPGSTSVRHPKTPRDPQPVVKALPQLSPAVRKELLSLKSVKEGQGRAEGAARSLKGKGSWARVEKLSQTQSTPLPQDMGTHRDSDEETGTASQAEGQSGTNRDIAFTHCVEGGNGSYGEDVGRRGAGRGRAGLHRLQIQRLTPHPGRPLGQLPDATSVLGCVTPGCLD